jgi:hypothetical protein
MDTVYQICPFKSHGRYYYWQKHLVSPFLDSYNTNHSETHGLMTTLIPPGVNVQTLNRIRIDASGSGFSGRVRVSNYDCNDDNFPSACTLNADDNLVVCENSAISSTSQQIRVGYLSTGQIYSIQGYTYGWIEDIESM